MFNCIYRIFILFLYYIYAYLLLVYGILPRSGKLIAIYNNNNNNNNNNKASGGMGEVAPLSGVDSALVLTNPGVQ